MPSNEFTQKIGIDITVTGAQEGVAGVNALTEALNKLNEVGGSIGNLGKDFQKVAGAAGLLGDAFKGLLGGLAIKKAFQAIGSAVGKSNEYVENLNLFNTVMGKYTAEAENYANQVNAVMGIDVSQWIRYQGVFMSLGKGFGVASDRAYTMSKNLTQLGYDISALFNLDVDEAMLKLESGFAGELEPLRRIGFDLSKARLEAIAAELNITKSYNAMTQAEKAQLRYYAILTQLPQLQGAMGREMVTLTTQIRLLKQAFNEAGRAIGNIFVPFLTQAIPYVIAFVRVLRDAANFIAKLFGFELPKIDYSGVKETEDVVDGLADDLGKATGRAKALKRQLAGFDEINNLTTPTPSSRGSGSVDTGSWIDFPLPEYDFLKDVEDQITSLTLKIKEVLPELTALAVGFAAFMIVKGVTDLISGFGTALTGLFTIITQNPIAAVIALIASVIAYLYTLYQTNEQFRAKVDSVIASVKNAWSGFVAFIKPIIANIAAWFVNTWDKIKTSASNAVTFVKNVWNGAKTVLSNVWNGLKTGAVNAWEGIKSVFAKVGTFFKDTFTKAWTAVKNVFSTGGKIFDGIKEGIATVFKTVVNAIITGINKVVSVPFNAINKLLGKLRDANIFGITPFKNLISTITVPQIPKLAKGGIVDQATLSVIGEAGTEAVVPLERNTGWINTLATKVNSAGTNNTDSLLETLIEKVDAINLTPYITVTDIGQASVNYINKQSRLMGESVVK